MKKWREVYWYQVKVGEKFKILTHGEKIDNGIIFDLHDMTTPIEIRISNALSNKNWRIKKDDASFLFADEHDEVFTWQRIVGQSIYVLREIDNMKKKEEINHPDHYNKGYETIKFIESWEMNYNDGNVIKYITRAPYKGTEKVDRLKALWYCAREAAAVDRQATAKKLRELAEEYENGD